MHSNKVFVVIAAHNEEKSIASVLKDLKSHRYSNIVVVDDGSLDDTGKIAAANGAAVLRHLINRGQGAALKTGIDYALQNGADIIATFDADGQHLAKDLAALIRPVADGKADIALGSRFLKKSDHASTPTIRGLVLQGGAFLFRVLYGISLTDSHNGLRAMSRKAAGKMDIKSDMMGHANEIVEIVAKNKLKFVEVPVTIPYSEYSKVHSHHGSFAGLKTLAEMLREKIVK